MCAQIALDTDIVSKMYDRAEGSFIWNFPRSFPVKFLMKFPMNSSSDDISYEIF